MQLRQGTEITLVPVVLKVSIKLRPSLALCRTRVEVFWQELGSNTLLTLLKLSTSGVSPTASLWTAESDLFTREQEAEQMRKGGR